MSLQTIEINSVKIVFDEAKTKSNVTDFNAPCDCQDCRNYYKNIQNKVELLEFLESFGIDFLRPEEICPYELGSSKDSLIKYHAYYSVSGHISKEFSIIKEDYSIFFETSSNVNVGHEISDDFFFIVIEIDLPYILDEERELLSNSFLGKCIDKIKLIFKKR